MAFWGWRIISYIPRAIAAFSVLSPTDRNPPVLLTCVSWIEKNKQVFKAHVHTI